MLESLLSDWILLVSIFSVDSWGSFRIVKEGLLEILNKALQLCNPLVLVLPKEGSALFEIVLIKVCTKESLPLFDAEAYRFPSLYLSLVLDILLLGFCQFQ
jgi:hypothetical protein